MAVKYIPFFPEPIEGQAILNNFNRTLRYKGNTDVAGRLSRGSVLAHQGNAVALVNHKANIAEQWLHTKGHRQSLNRNHQLFLVLV